jgi:chloramphenicol O-acetyltransferase
MRVIDFEDWPRREHFRLYSAMEFPHVGLCVQLEITELWANRARADASPTVQLVYVITKAANGVPEFRQRIRGEQVVEHDVVHPSIAVLGGDDVFGVVSLVYDADFAAFAPDAGERLAKAKAGASLAEFAHDPGAESHRDDVLSITVAPWFSFTGFSLTRRPREDSIPLVAWGKVMEEGDRCLLPFYVNVHHALIDGLHVARFLKRIEDGARELAGRVE